MSDQETHHHQEQAAEVEVPISLTAQLQKAQALLSDESDDTTTTTTDKNNTDASQNAQQQIHPPAVRAIVILENIQDQIQRSSLFSTNESLDDVQTSSLVLISTEYHLGKAYLQLPTTLPSSNGNSRNSSCSSIIRNKYVLKAVEFFHIFLERCDVLEGLLEDAVTKDYRSLLITRQTIDDDDNDNENGNGSLVRTAPIHAGMPSSSSSSNRDTKIARYRQTQTLKSQTAHLNALLSQRQRLHLASHEDLDGHDEETLHRSLSISTLNLHSLDSLDELHNCGRELEMLHMAVRMERQRATESHHTGQPTPGALGHSAPDQNDARQRRPHKPLDLTRVTQDPATGQLLFRKEQVRAQVFRPGWNQPTMTLEELGEREVAEAMERSERQAVAEEAAKLAPRRYDQLVRDGLEDDAELVEASAVLDRRWDDWKDANPRGSGNKMGDVGDRNF